MKSKTTCYKKQWSVNIQNVGDEVQKGFSVILQNKNQTGEFQQPWISCYSHICTGVAVVIMSLLVTIPS